jgi:hypothetical protein
MDIFCFMDFRYSAEYFIMKPLTPGFAENKDSPYNCCASYSYGTTRLAAAGAG